MIIDFNRYNGGGGSGSGVTPEQVQQQIDSALTPYWESGETKDYVDSAVSGISLDGYYTSAQTDAAISAATSRKANAASVEGDWGIPRWNSQGIIIGKSKRAYSNVSQINGANFYVYSEETNPLPNIYAPTTPGTAGDILVSPGGNQAPIWSAMTFITSADVETQIEAKNYVNSGDVKSQVEAYNYATVSQIPTVPTSNTAFTNDAGYITDAAIENLVTSAQVETQITSKGYATVSQIPTVPTSNTAFTNDAGYVTSAQVETQIVEKNYITSAAIANMVTSTYVSTIWRGAQSDYDAIVDKDPNTFYIIVSN